MRVLIVEDEKKMADFLKTSLKAECCAVDVAEDGERVKLLVDILRPASIALTIRVGVETQNDQLRLRVLRKGHKRTQLYSAMEVMKSQGVTSGGYVLLKPAPNKSLRVIMDNLDATDEEVDKWAVEETKKTLDFVLGKRENDLGMDEAYYGPTCVGPDTPLTALWQSGEFWPVSLWMVFHVLRGAIERYGSRVHLLPFVDVPPFLAVPSTDHDQRWLPENLDGAVECALKLHSMFDHYRETMQPSVLLPPLCECRPKWL